MATKQKRNKILNKKNIGVIIALIVILGVVAALYYFSVQQQIFIYAPSTYCTIPACPSGYTIVANGQVCDDSTKTCSGTCQKVVTSTTSGKCGTWGTTLNNDGGTSAWVEDSPGYGRDTIFKSPGVVFSDPNKCYKWQAGGDLQAYNIDPNHAWYDVVASTQTNSIKLNIAECENGICPNAISCGKVSTSTKGSSLYPNPVPAWSISHGSSSAGKVYAQLQYSSYHSSDCTGSETPGTTGHYAIELYYYTAPWIWDTTTSYSTPQCTYDCNTATDCSGGGTGDKYCDGSALKQDTKTPTCSYSSSKGKKACGLTTSTKTVQTCQYGCDAGTCKVNPCGNWVCDNGETYSSCSQDCPNPCGNGVCDNGETWQTCSQDCTAPNCYRLTGTTCTTELCSATDKTGLYNTQSECQAHITTPSTPNQSSNNSGGGSPPSPPGFDNVCGNSQCEAGESCRLCPQDCGICPNPCGNGICDNGETTATCLADCPAAPSTCGDSKCSTGETCNNCFTDCGRCPVLSCGDGICSAGAGESCLTCSADCGVCPTQNASCKINDDCKTDAEVKCTNGQFWYHQYQCTSGKCIILKDNPPETCIPTSNGLSGTTIIIIVIGSLSVVTAVAIAFLIRSRLKKSGKRR